MAEHEGTSSASSGEPWWYSGPNGGSDPDPDGAADGDAADDASGAVDWMGMLAGAARMVDWARGAVLDPHAEHVDPAEHPDCMICRTIVVVGDQVGMPSRREAPPTSGVPESPQDAEPIRWIALRDGRPGADPLPTKAG